MEPKEKLDELHKETVLGENDALPAGKPQVGAPAGELPAGEPSASAAQVSAPTALATGNLKKTLLKAVNAGAFLCAVLCLAVTLFAAGFLTCVATPLPTRMLASATVTDSLSPYTHDELVESAVAIYDYSFARHDADALNAFLDSLVETATNDARIPQGAQGEQYRLDSAAIAHLDDCWNLAGAVRVPLIAIALLAVAACAHVGVRMGRRTLGRALLAAGALTLAAFAVCAAAACINFDAFFSLFHGLFFAQGTWTFWYKSLLICSLPEAFWMGMGVLWFATTFALALICCFVGRHLRKMR